jgi:hypothetical protein
VKGRSRGRASRRIRAWWGRVREGRGSWKVGRRGGVAVAQGVAGGFRSSSSHAGGRKVPTVWGLRWSNTAARVSSEADA